MGPQAATIQPSVSGRLGVRHLRWFVVVVVVIACEYDDQHMGCCPSCSEWDSEWWMEGK